MVDVGDKVASDRSAHARSIVRLPEAVAAQVSGDEIRTKKGPVFSTAIVAGVMAAKKTHELIPFCHPLGLENCKVTIELDGNNPHAQAGQRRSENAAARTQLDSHITGCEPGGGRNALRDRRVVQKVLPQLLFGA